jgi:hypothetical protein
VSATKAKGGSSLRESKDKAQKVYLTGRNDLFATVTKTIRLKRYPKRNNHNKVNTNEQD